MGEIPWSVATRLTPSGEGAFDAEVPEGWRQGRGAFGGLVVGLLARALEHTREPERTLRALSAEIPSPVLVGPVRLEVEVGRRGSALSNYAVRLVQDGEVKARASAVVGAERPVDVHGLWLEPPRAGAWDATPAAPVGPPLAPEFATHYEYRPRVGIPMTGATEPRVEGWVRPREALPRWGAPELAALVDAYWMTVWAMATDGLRPAATVGYGLFLTAAAASVGTDAPLYYRAGMVQAGAGFAFEQRELWTADGALVAVNPQTIAIIK